ncbi:MAG: hypothetical protein Kow0032_08540 [Methyloligellaceae bacterium]
MGTLIPGRWPAFFLKILPVSAAVVVAGCVKPRKFPRYVTVSEIIDNVRCELHKALWEVEFYAGENGTLKSGYNSKYRPGLGIQHWLAGYSALFDISLVVFKEGGATGDASLVVPFERGALTIALNAGLTKSSKSTLSFDFFIEDLGAFSASLPSNCVYDKRRNRGRYLEGETGLRGWLGALIEGMDARSVRDSRDGFSYAVEFIVTANGNITPSSRSVPKLGHNVTTMLRASRQRKDTHTLTIVITPQKGESRNYPEEQLEQLNTIGDLMGTNIKIGKYQAVRLKEIRSLITTLDSRVERIEDKLVPRSAESGDGTRQKDESQNFTSTQPGEKGQPLVERKSEKVEETLPDITNLKTRTAPGSSGTTRGSARENAERRLQRELLRDALRSN